MSTIASYDVGLDPSAWTNMKASGGYTKMAQSFQSPGGIWVPTAVSFVLKKTGLPSGNITFYIGGHTGTYADGSSKPNTTVYAYSDTTSYDTLLTTSWAYVELSMTTVSENLSGVGPFTVYLVITGGSTGNTVDVAGANSNPVAGNAARWLSSWSALGTTETSYIVTGDPQGVVGARPSVRAATMIRRRR